MRFLPPLRTPRPAALRLALAACCAALSGGCYDDPVHVRYDATPLVIRTTIPQTGDPDVSTTGSITVRFQEPITFWTVDESSLYLTRGGQVVPCSVSVHSRDAILTPMAPLLLGADYVGHVTTRIRGVTDVSLGRDYFWNIHVTAAPIANGNSSRVAWSPDGTRIAYSALRAGQSDIWIHSIADGSEARFTNSPEPDWYPTWSPDGTEIAYSSGAPGLNNVWVAPVSGGPARQLTSDPFRPNFLDWSPDGTWIAFSHEDALTPDLYGAYRVPAQGGPPERLPGPDWMARVVWSPDGTRLAFGGYAGLSIVPADGGDAVVLLDDTWSPLQPDWSPDGTALVFRSSRRRDATIWTIPVEGGAPRPLATDDDDSYPAWSPDGRYVAFTSWRSPHLGNIWIIEAP